MNEDIVSVHQVVGVTRITNTIYIYTNFNCGSSSYISSRVTKRDNEAGGFVNAELWNSGSSGEFGSLIDRFGANLNANKEWVQVHYNSVTHNKTYVAAGSTQLSKSHKMKASVENKLAKRNLYLNNIIKVSFTF